MLQIRTKDLRECMKLHSKIVDGKSTDPTLNYIHFYSKDDTLFVFSTDLESGAVSRIEIVSKKRDVDVLIPYLFLKQYLDRKNAAPDIIEIDDAGMENNNSVLINTNILNTLSVCEYPVCPAPPVDNTELEIIGDNELKSMLLSSDMSFDNPEVSRRDSRDYKKFQYVKLYENDFLLNVKQLKILQSTLIKDKDTYFGFKRNDKNEACMLYVNGFGKSGSDLFFKLSYPFCSYKKERVTLLYAIREHLATKQVESPVGYLEVESKKLQKAVKTCGIIFDKTRSVHPIELSYNGNGKLELTSRGNIYYTVYSHDGNQWDKECENGYVEQTRQSEGYPYNDETYMEHISSWLTESNRHSEDIIMARELHREYRERQFNFKEITFRKDIALKLMDYIDSPFKGLRARPALKEGWQNYSINKKQQGFFKDLRFSCISKIERKVYDKDDESETEKLWNRITRRAKTKMDKYQRLFHKIDRLISKEIYNMKVPERENGHYRYLPVNKEHEEMANVRVPTISNGIPAFDKKLYPIADLKSALSKLTNNVYLGFNDKSMIIKDETLSYTVNQITV